MRLSKEDHQARKAATRQVYLDDRGKPVSESAKSVAVQDKRDSCDVNRIVKKVIDSNGNVNVSALPGLVREGRYGDFRNAVDFQECSNRVIRMNNAFMTLDPHVRLKFDNDPAKMLDYLDSINGDLDKEDEAVKMGLLPKPVFKTEKIESPEGNFWVRSRNGREISRELIKPAASKTPEA